MSQDQEMTCERGQAMVETALILLVFLMTVFAIFELGRMIQVQQTLTDGARIGARYAVAPLTRTSSLPSAQMIDTLVQEYLNAAHIYGAVVTETPVTGALATYSEVIVRYDYRVMTIPMFGVFNIQLTGRSLMRNETSS
jgi:Flp pilus assembly protein TadG